MMSFGLCSCASALHRVVVDLFAVVQAVAHDLEPLAGNVERHAVRQVSAFGERQTHDRVTRIQQGQQDRGVRLRTRVRLHVRGELDPRDSEQLLEPFERQRLGDVDVLAAAVVALAGIALGVLVGELAALRRHDRGAGVVLRGNQLDVLLLARVLLADGGPEFRIDRFDGVGVTAEHADLDKWNQDSLAIGPRRTAGDESPQVSRSPGVLTLSPVTRD